jgi:protease-4
MKSSTKLFICLLSIIGLLALAAVVLIVIGILIIMPARRSIPDRVILEVDLEKQVVEHVPLDPLAQAFMREVTTVRDIVEALERASEDEHVIGLVARVGVAPVGLAVIQEIRDAVGKFAESGKFTVAYAETFGEFGPGNGAYYLATAFDEIYLQPSGDIGLTGIMYQSPFVRGTLDKLKITPRIDHRREFKNAKNIFTETEYTEAHEKAVKKVMDSHFSQIVQGIIDNRGISEEQLIKIIDNAPLLGAEAIDAKLVDQLLYRNEVYEKVKAKAKGAKLLYLRKYLERVGRPHRKGAKIALIYGVGGVHRGQSGYSAFSASSSMGSDTIAAAFRDAVADKKVKAIVFRVNSPGGSYVASDTIWNEVAKAGDADKPVIVSMGNVAGSGGYFVSMAASKIVAQPGTITGSIGVLTGKLLTRDFWKEHIGITFDDVQTSKNANIWNSSYDYSPEQWQKLQEILDRVYDDFTTKVAEGRNMEKEKVLSVAKGRIWTGEDAKELGLVDELGGFDVALRLAREQAGIEPDAPINLKVFPRPKRMIEQFLQRGPDNSEPRTEVVMIEQLLKEIRPLYKMAKQIGLFEDNDILRMPQFEVNW